MYAVRRREGASPAKRQRRRREEEEEEQARFRQQGESLLSWARVDRAFYVGQKLIAFRSGFLWGVLWAGWVMASWGGNVGEGRRITRAFLKKKKRITRVGPSVGRAAHT